MKKLITLVAVALLALGAQAQTPRYQPAPAVAFPFPAAGISNFVTLGLSPTFIDCSKQQNVGISIVSGAAGATTANVGFVFTPTIDGTTNTMLTNLSSTIVTTLNGTSPVYWGTNLNAQGFRGFLVTQATNGAAAVVTNQLTYGNKISAP